MRVLEQLEPKNVLSFFEDLCAIPHGSGNTKAISDYCVKFAESRGLEVHQDGLNNVVIVKPATPGYEAAPTVIVQGHLDMVAEKTPDSPINFLTDGLELEVDGDFIRAKGTTLGGDDGIAVAMALAVLDAKDLSHPRLECLFTVDEETGMDGAVGFDASILQGKRLLNIDSEAEGILTVSCAGGAHAAVRIPMTTNECALDSAEIRISGLKGGHSGAEIDKGRANATITLGRVLQALVDELEVRLVSAEGGLKDNAIPNAARAVIALEDGKLPRAQEICAELQDTFRREYAAADPDVTVTFTPGTVASQALTLRDTKKVCCFLGLYPNGIESMSMDIPGLVQTSCNLGIFKVNGSGLVGSGSVRSSIASRKQLLLRRIGLLAEGLDGTLCVSGEYPAWEYRRESHLRDVMCKVYKDQYGQDMKVEAIHAGLECGLFCGKIPGLDAVSFGPNLYDIHTTSERMSISSVQRVYAYLCAVLQALKD